MKKFKAAPAYAEGRRRLRAAECVTDLDDFVELLLRGRPLPPRANDHTLLPPLTGWRSCIVGHAQGTPVVLIYRDAGAAVRLLSLNLHDDAYRDAAAYVARFRSSAKR